MSALFLAMTLASAASLSGWLDSGGSYGRANLSGMWSHQPVLTADMLQVRHMSEVPLDGTLDPNLGQHLIRHRSLLRIEAADDMPLLLGRQARAKEALWLATAWDAPAIQEVSDGLYRITHYFCASWNYGDAYYCGYMASGQVVHPGAAACFPDYMGKALAIQGVVLRCEDTGGAVGPRNIDVWCWSPSCWDEICGQPCPTFADWEEVEWLK